MVLTQTMISQIYSTVIHNQFENSNIKIKISALQKADKKMKREATNKEKIFAKHIPYKGISDKDIKKDTYSTSFYIWQKI